MAARRAAARPRSRKEVNYTWSQFNTGTRVNVPAATKVLLGFFFLATAFEETVVRTRGVMTVITDQAAAGEDQIGALGMIRVTDRAIAAGIASIPGPMTDGDDDGWFLWVPTAQMQTNPNDTYNGQVIFDSKAQRIVREGQQLAVVFENGGPHGLNLVINMRALSRFRS